MSNKHRTQENKKERRFDDSNTIRTQENYLLTTVLK